MHYFAQRHAQLHRTDRPAAERIGDVALQEPHHQNVAHPQPAPFLRKPICARLTTTSRLLDRLAWFAVTWRTTLSPEASRCLRCSHSSSGCTRLSSAAPAAALLNPRAAAIICSELQDNRIVGTLEPLGTLRRLRYLCALPSDATVALVCSRCREELRSDTVRLRPCEDLRSMAICLQ